jgi:hypothetical protein
MSDDVDLFGNKIPPETMYWVDPDKQIGASSLRNTDRETQIEVMKLWFHGRYEDPAENTPYVGSEGGYQFIHGGPFDPSEVLQDEFSGTVAEDAIEEFAHKLEGITDEWAPRDDGGYDNDLFDSITHFTERYRAFSEVLSSTRMLAEEKVPFPQQQHLHRLLYVSAIIAFETYLSDTFISSVCPVKARLRRFVETDRHFSKENVSIRSLFLRMDTIENDVKTYLLDLSWHRITDASRMFLETMNVRFPDDLEFLKEAIRVRHDIVHRGGKTRDGKEHQITTNDIKKVTQAVDEIVWTIESQMNPEAVRLSDEFDGLAEF